MNKKTAIFGGMIIGSMMGSYATSLIGADVFSFTSILGNLFGGIIGIWIAYKLF